MAITLASEISYNEVKKTSLENDQDVVIESDCWIGANVTISAECQLNT